MDTLRQRFGRDSVIRGIAYEGPAKDGARSTPSADVA